MARQRQFRAVFTKAIHAAAKSGRLAWHRLRLGASIPLALSLILGSAVVGSAADPTAAASGHTAGAHGHRAGAHGHRAGAHDPLLTIRTGGDRTSSAPGTATAGNPLPGSTGGNVNGVSGVTFSVTGPGGPYTCGPTGANGECSVDVAGGTYTITQTGVPSGSSIPQNNYFIINTLGTGTVTPPNITPTTINPFSVSVTTNTTVTAPSLANTSNTVRSGRWPVARYNPAPLGTCTRRVALLFDLSASITPAFLDNYKTAARSYVNSLLGTPTDVTIFTFGTAAPAPGAANATFGPESTTTTAGVDALVNKIDGLFVPAAGTGGAQFTNWDAGIWQMTTGARGAASLPYNQAIVMTDGDPTAMGSTGAPDTSSLATRLRAVENGIFSANALKADSTRILALGLEAHQPGSVHNLIAISGSVQGNLTETEAGMPDKQADYYLLDFDELADLLPEVAVENCASLEITKSANPTTFTHVGQEITYTYHVTNTSPADGFDPLHNIVVHDDRFGEITNCAPDPLHRNQVATCTFRHVITQADTNAGRVENSAFASGQTDTGVTVESPPDDEDITGERHAEIEITKTADPTTFTGTGVDIHYTFVVTNTGNVPLTNVHVVDDVFGAISCPTTMLAPSGTTGDSMTCTLTHSTTQANVNADGIHDEATVTGDPPPGLAQVKDEDTAEVTHVGTPRIEIEKSANPTTFDAPDQHITYTYVITNTGDVPLNNVQLTDDRIPGPFTCTPALGSTLAPNDHMTCTRVYTTTQADVNAGSIHNTATATGTPPPGLPGVRDESSETVTAGQDPMISITKIHTPEGPFRIGEVITYHYHIVNTGNMTLHNVQLTDDFVLPPFDCTPALGATLEPGETMDCTATHTVNEADFLAGEIRDVGTTRGTTDDGRTVEDDDHDPAYPESAPGIGLTKMASPTTFHAPGQTITYTYVITNLGDLTVNNIQLTDTRIPGPFTCTPVDLGGTLAPGDHTTCTATITTTQADVDAGSIHNVTTATGTASDGTPVRDEADENVTATTDPAIEITKTGSPQTFTGPGQAITYTYHITNAGNVTLHNLQLSDSRIPGPFTCTPVDLGGTLAPGDHTTCTATITTTQADVEAGSIFNAATATATDPEERPVTDMDEETVYGPPHFAAITIEKTGSPQIYTGPGQTIHYAYLVTNVGNLTLHDITVVDNKFGTITCPETTLAPGASMTCTHTHTTTQADVDALSIANTGTATGHPPTGEPVTDDDPETITPGVAPSIEITKTPSPTVYTMHGQPIRYTYTVANTGNVTLHNVTLTDTRFGTITCPESTLAPGASMTCTHTHFITDVDLSSGSIFNSAAADSETPWGERVPSEPAHATVIGKVIPVPPPPTPTPPPTPPPPVVPVTG